MIKYLCQVVFTGCLIGCASGPEVSTLWVPGDPAASEQQMRDALPGARGDEAIILRTQIARTFTFRRDFARAQQELRRLAPDLASAGSEAKTRYWLELGRTYASHQHLASEQTEASRAMARAAFENALANAQQAELDGLAVDALHMFAFVDTAPIDQFHWTQKALDAALASDQPAARRWEASLRSNLGEALVDLERYADALVQFKRSLVLKRNRGSSPSAVRDATWHVARTLRLMGELDAAMALQREVADGALTANEQRPYIHQELSLLYTALGDTERARHFESHRDALTR